MEQILDESLTNQGHNISILCVWVQNVTQKVEVWYTDGVAYSKCNSRHHWRSNRHRFASSPRTCTI